MNSLPRLRLFALACFAFVSALLTPAWARAALTPTCEGLDQFTRAPNDWATPTILDGREGHEMCDAGAGDVGVAPPPVEDLGDPRVPAMCDERGASMIAPPRILPMTDARFEAAPSELEDFAGMDRLDRGSGHEPQTANAPALADHALIERPMLVAAATYGGALLTFLPVHGEVLPGHRRRLDEPPR